MKYGGWLIKHKPDWATSSRVVLALLAGFLLLWSFAPQKGSVSLAPVPVKTAPAKKAETRKPVRASSHETPARSPESGTDAIPVQFPSPTDITITVAAAPQLIKLDHYQNPLNLDAKEWDCVKDATTGLVWEVKTHDRGLQDANNFYSWYEKGGSSGTLSGTRNGGKCRGGISCDTQSYVDAINEKRVCGYADWRLPSRNELMSLVGGNGEFGQSTTIDTRFFPSTPGDWYWTSDTDIGDSNHAWFVLFFNGRTMKAAKAQAKRVRLVRGEIEKRRSFKGVAEKKDNNPENELAKQPFQPESLKISNHEMLSMN